MGADGVGTVPDQGDTRGAVHAAHPADGRCITSNDELWFLYKQY
jgi:hypothetical protein